MSNIWKIWQRPYIKEKDKKILEKWRAAFNHGDPVLMLPNGYENRGIVTNVAVAGDGRHIASLSGTMIVALDPLLKNPNATKAELSQALFMLLRGVEVDAIRSGALESYIAIPDDLEDYQKIVEKAGFEKTAQGCTIYRHQFFPTSHKEAQKKDEEEAGVSLDEKVEALTASE